MTPPSKLDRLLAVLGCCLVGATAAVVVIVRPSDSAAQKAVLSDKIAISDFKFAPENVQVKRGATVTFVNRDAASHTATDSTTNAFDTGVLRKGDKKAITLSKAGSFNYICELHPFMKATIKVAG